MRARWLKPEFFTDRKIGKLGVHAALIFEALWCAADDGGVAECEAVLLKGQMFVRWEEITIEVIEDAISRLTAAGLTQHYRSGDGEYALIVSWRKNQRVHNPSPFRHPRPTKEVTGEDWPSLTEECGSDDVDARNDSHPISPDGQTPRHPESQTPNSAHQRRNGDASVFEEVWTAYPKRVGGDSKRDALLAFQARVRSGEDPALMLAGTRRYAAYCVATDKIGTEFVKQARTFFGRSRHYLEAWDPPAPKPPPGKRPPPGEYDYSHPTESAENLKWQ